ncbi:MAG: hypothetical protein JKY94_17480 [Rhodobacteraceae bacterium]|nr:hypothetical protein [Paracoccaceae bacterium]
MISLGFDPDLHSSGIAIVEDNKLQAVALTHVPASVTGTRACLTNIWSALDLQLPVMDVESIAIEYPQVYNAAKTKVNVDPMDLIRLTLVAGGASALFSRIYPIADQAFCLPAEWKGQVPKRVHHKRICEALDIPYVEQSGKIIPAWPSHTQVIGRITPSKAQHVLDAIGLALWARSIPARRHMVSAISIRS